MAYWIEKLISLPTSETYRELFGDKRAPDGSLARDNFASWFDKSAVVDDAGRPLVVFHGSVISGTNWGTPGNVLPKGAFAIFDKKAWERYRD